MKQLRWNKNPDIGWWLDNDPITFYHGTHIDNLESIKKNGIISDDYISLALEPYTAHGYAAMMGGEKSFTQAGKKAKTVPPEERVVLVIKIPKDVVLKNMAPERGAMQSTKGKLTDKSLYDIHKGNDHQYYQLTEIRMPKKIDSRYIVGWMKK